MSERTDVQVRKESLDEHERRRLLDRAGIEDEEAGE